MVICQVLPGCSQITTLIELELHIVGGNSVQLEQRMLKLSRALRQNSDLGGPFYAFAFVIVASWTFRGGTTQVIAYSMLSSSGQRMGADGFGLYQSLYKSWFV